MTTDIMEPVSELDALRWLADRSPYKAGTYEKLGEQFGWQQTMTWKVVKGRWADRHGWVSTTNYPLVVTVHRDAIPDSVWNDENHSEGREKMTLTTAQDEGFYQGASGVAEREENASDVVYGRVAEHSEEHAIEARADGLDWLARLVAIGMATVTAYFSIHGLLTLFPGDEIGVTVFGIGVECLKVVGVMYLSRHARAVWWLWRMLAIVTVIVAASLNSASVYAKFASLHASSPASAAATREASAAELDARIEAAQGRVNDLTRRASTLDDTVDAVGKRSNARNANRTINNTRDDRTGLSNDRQAAANDLARLRADRGRITAAGHQASAEELPVTLMASLFATDAATILKWLVCAVVIVGDPAALVLLAAVGSRRRRWGTA